MNEPVMCPTCGQPASPSLSRDGALECRNEACPEYGQLLDLNEPAPAAPPTPMPPSFREH